MATAFPLTELSLEELRNLASAIPLEIRKREEANKKEALAEVNDLLKARGITLDDLLGASGNAARGAGAAKRRVQPKYRHPENPALTWTGRGRQPKWLVELLASGKTLEELVIAS